MQGRSSFSTLTTIHEAVKAGETSVKSIVQDHLRIIKERSHLNIFNEVFEEETLNRADAIDQRIASGKEGKLAGAVIGIKDNLCYKDHRVSASSRILEGFESQFTATAVDRLLQEDAVIIGRLNCDEFAMGGSNENSAYGPVQNPIDEARVPGGSSGGSAAAVKAGMCHAALGSDTGGSIRQPAAFCGVTGLKPTYGRISRYGLIAYASSFDQIGPLTNNVPDAALLTEVISGADAYDSTVSTRPVPSYSGNMEDPGPKKIAFLKDCLDKEGLDPEVRERTQQVLKLLEEEGHSIEPVSFPYLDHVVPAYQILSNAEASSNLARYDGIHYGYRSEEADSLRETYETSRTEGFGKEVKRRIMLGTFVLSSGYYEAYYGHAQKVRRMIRDHTDALLQNYDFLFLPTTPNPPFKRGELVNDPITMYLQDIFTVHANLSGHPAISVPAGSTSHGLPIGIQLMGRWFGEKDLLSFADSMEGLFRKADPFPDPATS